MEITVQITANDYLRSQRLGLRLSSKVKILLVLFAVFFFAWQSYKVISGGNLEIEFWVILTVAIYFTLLYFVITPWRVKRLFRQQKTLHVPAVLGFSDSHFSGSSEHGSFEMKWEDFHKWRKNKHLIMIYQSEALMHIIPIRAFESKADVDSLEVILKKHLGNEQ